MYIYIYIYIYTHTYIADVPYSVAAAYVLEKGSIKELYK